MHLDLFSGIGGFALAARWMGWQTVQFVEIDNFCQKVLTKNFPNVPIHGDIKTFNGESLRGTIDILTGGFPCQPFSAAGKRKGTEDSRHLWPEMLRVIGEVQPSVIVGENVYGLLNWSGGLVFQQVQTDLENLGYSVTPFVLPACGIQAPHRRDRVWFVAHSGMYRHSDQPGENRRETGQNKRNGNKWEWVRVQSFGTSKERSFANPGNKSGRSEQGCDDKRKWELLSEEQTRGEVRSKIARCSGIWTTTNNNNKRLQGGAIDGSVSAIGQESGQLATGLLQPGWQDFPTQSPVCGGNDGIPRELYIIRQQLEYDESSPEESESKGSFAIWKAMRTMWDYHELAETSPELFINKVCDSLSIVSCKEGPIGWLQEDEEAKELRCMWESFYTKSYKEAQNLQSRMLECYRKIERRKKVEKRDRANRIKALGNSIVPQVAFEIFKAIEACRPIN